MPRNPEAQLHHVTIFKNVIPSDRLSCISHCPTPGLTSLAVTEGSRRDSPRATGRMASGQRGEETALSR